MIFIPNKEKIIISRDLIEQILRLLESLQDCKGLLTYFNLRDRIDYAKYILHNHLHRRNIMTDLTNDSKIIYDKYSLIKIFFIGMIFGFLCCYLSK